MNARQRFLYSTSAYLLYNLGGLLSFVDVLDEGGRLSPVLLGSFFCAVVSLCVFSCRLSWLFVMIGVLETVAMLASLVDECHGHMQIISVVLVLLSVAIVIVRNILLHSNSSKASFMDKTEGGTEGRTPMVE